MANGAPNTWSSRLSAEGIIKLNINNPEWGHFRLIASAVLVKNAGYAIPLSRVSPARENRIGRVGRRDRSMSLAQKTRNRQAERSCLEMIGQVGLGCETGQ
jgi:hypothetical protein